MDTTEVVELLTKMGALIERDGLRAIDSRSLMQDPIVTNRLAVELLQHLDRDAKPEVVIAPSGEGSYFGYSVALAAWMRFLYAEEHAGSLVLAAGTSLKKNERALVVFDSFDASRAQALVDLITSQGGRPLAVLALTGGDGMDELSYPTITLI